MENAFDWPIRLHLLERDGHTEACLSLDTILTQMRSVGLAQRNPGDPENPLVGDELAAGRALIDLGNRLIRLADAELDDAGERARGEQPVRV